MNTISAVVITYNEEKNIGRCLESMQAVVDELLVVDSFSTDRTREICEALGARFVENPFVGHIEQKNFAGKLAKSDYVLSLDADEALSDEMRENILAEKDKLDADAYAFNRLTNYCGKWIKHSGWYPDVKVRMFKRGTGGWGGRNPHDRFIPNEPKGLKHMSGDILHYTFYTVEEHQAQVVKFSDIASKAMFEEGRRSSWFKVIFAPVFKFIRNYILLRGFLDGKEGWLICTISAKASYLKYSKLLKLQNAPGHQKS